MKQLVIFITIFLFIIIGPDFFFKSGFFYNLDSVFFPIYKLPNFFSETIFRYFYYVGQYFLGYELFSKIFFILNILLLIFLGYKISNYIIKNFEIKNKEEKFLLNLLGIFFLIAYPFLYERIMTQVGISIGVGFIGLGFIYLLEYLKENVNKKLYLSTLFFGLSLTVFSHSIVFIIIIGILTLLFFYKKFSIKKIFLSVFIFIFININWIIGSIFLDLKKENFSEIISTFNKKNIEVFVQNSQSNLGVELTSFFGYGFWGERYNHVFGPENIFKFWFIFAIIIFIIIGIGAYNFYKKDKKLFYYFLWIYIIFYILALGISSPIFSWFNIFLYENIPYYIGMREPGKFLGMIAILNSIFFTVGIYYLGNYITKKEFLNLEKSKLDFYIFIILIFVLINAYSPGNFWGYRGQLQISKYPEEYFLAKEFLEEKKEFKNVIFPWHTYSACKWGNTRVFSTTFPMILNFSETIKADNIEIEGLYTNYDNPISKQVEKFLETKDLEILKNLKIQNIIFQDYCGSYEKYDFLEKLDGIEKVFNKKYLKIYKINYEKK